MKINQVLTFNNELKIQINGPEYFLNLGTLLSQEEALLSYASSPAYLRQAIEKQNLVALFVKKDMVTDLTKDISFVFTDDAFADFYLFHNYLVENTDFYGVSRPSKIAGSARIHRTAYVADVNVEIADDVSLGQNVVIMENTVINSGVYIGPGTVIGIEGTQTIPIDDRKHFRIIHAGGVTIGMNTFIGANSVVVKSVFREHTIIGENVTIGNLVNIGHNTYIGNDSVVLANSVVCGSSVIEKRARISPGATISSSKKVGEDAWVTIGAVVTKDVERGQRVSGNFAIEHQKLVNHVKKLSRSDEGSS